MNKSPKYMITLVLVCGCIALNMPSLTFANAHPKPREDSISFLDQSTYIRNMAIRAHLSGDNRRWKMQMMSVGERRYLFQGGKPLGDVIDVTDPLNPVVINEDGFLGRQLQLAYNKKASRWVLITGSAPPLIRATEQYPHGKYDDPTANDRVTNFKGLRGIRLYDASDPRNLQLLSEFSTDGGDPSRELQTGGGTHRDFYDGGRYAYLDASPDDSFVHQESPVRIHTHGLMIVDVMNPEEPRHVSTWWLPGQRDNETVEYEAWREYGDKHSFTGLHGPFYVPNRQETGGLYAYSAWGSFGVFIHDISDIKEPRLVGRFEAPYMPGAIAFHAVDASRLERGFIIGSPETLNPDCNEPFHDSWVIDVSNPSAPKALSTLPIPKPPDEAPYSNFCQKRGRFGPHNSPHIKAPGTVHPDFTCYTFFNAGLQCYDISDPEHPFITAYFIPPQGGDLETPGSYTRNTDNVFIEWDRKLIWVATDTGLYLVTSPALGEPVLRAMPVSEWTLDELNQLPVEQ
ncbi:LVIVD repeat-containing protein [Pseudomonadota bacterium]